MNTPRVISPMVEQWAFMLVYIIPLLLVVAAIFKRSKSTRHDMPYVLRPLFLTDNEREFFAALRSACGPEYEVFAQVRFADLMMPGLPIAALNRVASKSVDFVVCQAGSLTLIAVVELDDKSHRQVGRRRRDALVAAICNHINLSLLRFPAERHYEVDRVRAGLPFLLLPPM